MAAWTFLDGVRGFGGGVAWVESGQVCGHKMAQTLRRPDHLHNLAPSRLPFHEFQQTSMISDHLVPWFLRQCWHHPCRMTSEFPLEGICSRRARRRRGSFFLVTQGAEYLDAWCELLRSNSGTQETAMAL